MRGSFRKFTREKPHQKRFLQKLDVELLFMR